MKKSLLNIAVSMALSGAVFSGSVLSTQAYADELAPADNITSNDSTSETYMYPGMGVGAATGTLIAGPVGLVVGGIIGGLVGSNQEVSTDIESDTDAGKHAASTQDMEVIAEDIALKTASIDTENPDNDNSIQLAQLGPVGRVISDNENTAHEELMNILVTDLNLDVYFRSGSTDIEKFYPARLAAIADLVQTMGDLELHLDGYTDRRGNKQQNLALANERIQKVREQLIAAGVDEERIISKAFGEAKMKSSAGNLEAYTFDRRVVIRFERARKSIAESMAEVFTTTREQPAEVSITDESINPVVADTATRF
ncbi:MAG: sortase-associated OmpA-like protein PdsO [Gammaproteobacteria bacterium]|nr:sortase-associated OmpA-like protein PdsO [Gammaproteobacteria bacterium]